MRRKRNSSRSRVLPSVVIAVSTLAAAYLGMSLYSANHFHLELKLTALMLGVKLLKMLKVNYHHKCKNTH